MDPWTHIYCHRDCWLRVTASNYLTQSENFEVPLAALVRLFEKGSTLFAEL
jgi:hypothetical protein